MAGKTRITSSNQKVKTPKEKKKMLSYKEKLGLGYPDNPDNTNELCWGWFLVDQMAKSNSKATIDSYFRFYKKYIAWIMDVFKFDKREAEEAPVELLSSDTTQFSFIIYLKAHGAKSQQTVNHYLRSMRVWGNWCEEKGYIKDFKCPIKEVEPPVKETYTAKEKAALTKKPPIEKFGDYRAYCIIMLILGTGARSNTILNIKVGDVDLQEGYISFNTTKAHKVVRLGLEAKLLIALREWIQYWRIDKGASPNDFLFCNEYGEQMARSTLDKAIREYNHKCGVQKTSIHLLRHTFAKDWIMSGGDIITLAQVLTHSELDMVKRYANLYNTDIKSAIMEHSSIAQMKTKSGKTIKNK